MVQPANRRIVTEATVASHVATQITTPGSAAAVALKATYVDRASAPLSVLNFGAVADDPGNGTGTDNRVAFQNALAEAAAAGVKRVIVPGATNFYRITTATTPTLEGATAGYGVHIPAGVELVFEAGAKVYATNVNTASDRPAFLLHRSHDAAIVGLNISGSMTSHATRTNLTAIKEYRSKRARIISPVINGTADTVTVIGNPVAGSSDNTEDLTLENVEVGPLVGGGPHFFGAHARTRGKGLLVHGTLVYDALQIEAPGAVDASRGFYWEGIDIRSCAARGIFINPNNITPHLKDVKVRNPGRLATGAIVGYDQNVPANATNNSCISVFGSGAILEDIDVSGGLTVNPTNQPAVSWTQAGYGVTLSSTHDVEFRGYTKFGTNDGGDVFVDSPTGYNINQKGVSIARPERKPVIVQGTSSTMPVPVLSNASPAGTSRAKLVSLFPTWNVAGPDAAPVGWFPVSGVVSSVIPSTESVGHSRLRVTETTGNFSSVTVPLPSTVQLAKNGVAHLLMVAKFNAPAPQLSWALGNVTARRTTFAEATTGRDYQAGVTRRIQSTVRFSAADTLTNSFQIWWHYGSTVTNLDMEIEAMWLYVGDDPYAAPPVFDYSTPEGSQAAPTLGTWARGQTVVNTSPAASGTMGWVCTAAGTPGTWKTHGAIGA